MKRLASLLILASGVAFAQPVPPSAGPAPAAEPPPSDPPAPVEPIPPAPPPAPIPPISEPPALRSTQTDAQPTPAVAEKSPKSTPWYETIKIRGYTQFRYNRLPSLDSNPLLVNRQGDRTIGEGNGVSIRRARVIIFGDVHDHVSIYLQPDFASSIGDQGGVAILRDWYADLFFDKQKQFRLRVGQSKVPYGFENLQSSQNRLALDRNDALNSAVRDERDMGAFLYWSPPAYRKIFKHLVESGLKGSGDYGIVGLGVYNGQTANQPALADSLHVIGRVSVPFKLGEQFIEVGGGGYYGKYNVTVTDRADLDYVVPNDDPAITDARVFGTVVVYPQPIGFVAEYTAGRGPMQGRGTPASIGSRWLHGGYAQVMVKLDDVLGMVAVIPFVRGTYYDGGKKFFVNAPRYLVKEAEIGVELQIVKALEVVLAYDITSRTSDSYPYEQEAGQITRIQVQVNY